MPTLSYGDTMNPFSSKSSRSLKHKPTTITDKKHLGRSISHADDETLLINAVAHEDAKAVAKALRNKNIQIGALRHPGFSAFHHVCINGNLTILDMLLAYDGIDLNTKSKTGCSPLKLAVMHGHFDVASKLISLGAKEDDVKDGVQC